ncbi:MAG: hypothetical protein KAK00_11105 [Nanoarchaeota archaeon]|nr:hypothetical protein [Nanoarchaeota archaeon]
MKKWIVLKPTGPMNICNASMSISQGAVVPHPGYEVDKDTFDIFDDLEKARKAALKNVEAKNTSMRHGVTTKKTLAKQLATDAKAPSKEDRENVLKEAKIMTEDGLFDPKEVNKLQDENEALKKKIEEMESEATTSTFGSEDANALLDQNVRTTRKVITKQNLTPEEAKITLAAEKKGKKRGMILTLLSKLSDKKIMGK